MNNLLNLIAQLAPLATTFVPQAGEAAAIASLAAGLLAHIQQQTGKSTDEILADAGATLDDNEKKLLADQARLRGATP